MNLLLDSHTFLWFIEGNSKLSFQAKKLIEDQENGLLSLAGLQHQSAPKDRISLYG